MFHYKYNTDTFPMTLRIKPLKLKHFYEVTMTTMSPVKSQGAQSRVVLIMIFLLLLHTNNTVS